MLAKKTKKKKTTGGGGGFGSPVQTAKKKPTAKAVQKSLEKTYGGTSPQQIAMATQKRIDASLADQPEPVQRALKLYQDLQKWNRRQSQLSVLQLANLPESELEGAKRAQAELDQLKQDRNLSETDLHNLLQQMTWDASADAKAARAITGQMPAGIANKLRRACAILAEAVGNNGRCLDVGCGFGVLVPFLKKAGLKADQIVGVDLSPEMIRNAQEQHPGILFEATDFLQYPDEVGFEGIVFSSALHDFPSVPAALEKAISLLRPNGKLILLHAQGASHVLKQSSSNPILVKRGLPDADELKSLSGIQVLVEPAAAGSKEEIKSGYLAVLQKDDS